MPTWVVFGQAADPLAAMQAATASRSCAVDLIG